MNSKLKSVLSKSKFVIGCSPIVEKKPAWRSFIPKPYKAVLMIGADFELAWAWRFSKRGIGKPNYALEKGSLERKNIPELIKLCDKYMIPVTWATIGHLFLESCSAKDLPHSELPRPPFFENSYWRFCKGDWFQHDPCTNVVSAPEWYCPDLIHMILDAKTKHEIGCHTFSHIDCRDEVCTSEMLIKDIEACKEAVKPFNVELKSFVHPGYSIGNLDTLVNEGFTSFRTDYCNVLGYPQKHKNGLWEFKQTAEFYYKKEWSLDYHVYRFKKIIERAMSSNTICYFWFHPSFDPVVVERILPEVFQFIDENKDKIYVATTNEYVEWLGKNI